MKRRQTSSMHAKISGNFGEALVLYWLSKHGFECAEVDHTGIDIIASNPKTGKLMGISVKCRTRIKKGTERECVTIRDGEFAKMKAACKEFRCEPFFAIVVDARNVIRVFITSKSNFLKLSPRRVNSYWRMTKECLTKYASDKNVIAFELESTVGRWWEAKG